jgi:general secretion pathway protein E
MAQRLVRRICPHCREAYTPAREYIEKLHLPWEEFHDATLYRGRGCEKCLHTGYQGRQGIYELMVLSDHIKSLMLTTSDAGQIKRAAVANAEHPMSTLRQDGLHKVLEGKTTLEEVFRVA